MSSRSLDGARRPPRDPRVRTDDRHPARAGPRRAGRTGSIGHCAREQPRHRAVPDGSDGQRRHLRRRQPAAGGGRPHRLGPRLRRGHPQGLVARGRSDGDRATIELAVAGVRETVDVAVSVAGVDTTRSVVDAVIPSSAIEALPLNGRNFLELALLVPGNAPAPELRSDQVEQRGHLLGRPARTRRQHHHRRRRQQRRRGGRAAAERDPGGGAGVPDRDQPVHRRVGALGLVGDQRRDQVGQRPAARIGRRSSRATARGRRCRRPSTGRRATRCRSIASSSPAPRAVRWSRAGRSGSARSSTATRTAPCSSASATSPPRTIRRTFAPAPLDDLLGSGRVDWRPNGADALMVRYAGERGDDTSASSARPRDRLGLAAAAQPQQLPLGRGHLDARLSARRCSTPRPSRSAPSTTRSCRSRPGRS